MKIQRITINQPTNHQMTNKPSFKGWVNGNYYKDEVIKMAKEALNNPNWKQDLLKNKDDIGKVLSTWHKDLYSEQGGGATRFLSGVLSFGLSEVLISGPIAIGCAISNAKINKLINEIAKCLDDLRRKG